ncbi:MAG TPA: hypothetical protein VJQ84_05620 [Solirubrobacterales bacterium]|nr:hypothetical protein [Solirubrobacterales bacterium]
MREKLNENPLMQVALIGVLLVVAGVFVMSSMGGKGGEEEEAEPATVSATAASATEAPAGLDAALAMVSQASAGSAKPLPRDVLAAWNDNKTVVLLFVHDGGIDDMLVKDATERLNSLPAAATFVVPASKISRYAAVTEGVGVNRVPALVVVRPKHVHQTIPTASVNYGFQSGQSVVQAVIDAGYKGPTLDYHP